MLLPGVNQTTWTTADRLLNLSMGTSQYWIGFPKLFLAFTVPKSTYIRYSDIHAFDQELTLSKNFMLFLIIVKVLVVSLRAE